MTDELRPYPEYKDSGLPWLDRIPTHWEEKRAKYYFREVDERSVRGDEQLLSVSHVTGVTPRKANVTMFMAESNAGHKICRPGDLVINTMWAWMAAMGVARQIGLVSPSYGVYRPRRDDLYASEYVDHLLRTQPYASEYLCRSTGIRASRLRLYPDDFLDIRIVRPPVDEQKTMVTFIDRHDRSVRRFVRNRRRLIDVLNEQKQAIINRAVTRGLDPNVPLKPSGIDCLGDIPEHWQLRRIKQGASILRGKFTHRPRNDPAFYDGPYPFIQTGDVSRAPKFINAFSQTLNAKGLGVSKMFPAGTLVMTIAANIGDVAILSFDGCFPDSVIGLVPRECLFQDYFYYLLRALKAELVKVAPVTAQGNLNVERVGAISIPIPPVDEQRQLATLIEASTDELSKRNSQAQREIDLIREYRTRLIADVVTGKVDVRHLAPAPGDEPAETEPENLDEGIDNEEMNGDDEPELVEESADNGEAQR